MRDGGGEKEGKKRREDLERREWRWKAAFSSPKPSLIQIAVVAVAVGREQVAAAAAAAAHLATGSVAGRKRKREREREEKLIHPTSRLVVELSAGESIVGAAMSGEAPDSALLND